MRKLEAYVLASKYMKHLNYSRQGVLPGGFTTKRAERGAHVLMRSSEASAGSKPVRGFTLIELLVVIAIIGLLSSVVLASLNSARLKAQDARRLADMHQVENALALYYSTNGKYPIDVPTTYLLSALSTQLTTAYIPSLPVDPAGKTYLYGSDDAGTIYTLVISQDGANCEVRSPGGDPHWSFPAC